MDFGIHPTTSITPPVEVGEKISVKIACKGRSNVEYIGVLDEKWAVKVLSKIPLVPQQRVTVSVIKQNLKENLITAKISSSF